MLLVLAATSPLSSVSAGEVEKCGHIPGIQCRAGRIVEAANGGSPVVLTGSAVAVFAGVELRAQSIRLTWSDAPPEQPTMLVQAEREVVLVQGGHELRLLHLSLELPHPH
jgi:hypothetical protein